MNIAIKNLPYVLPLVCTAVYSVYPSLSSAVVFAFATAYAAIVFHVEHKDAKELDNLTKRVKMLEDSLAQVRLSLRR